LFKQAEAFFVMVGIGIKEPGIMLPQVLILRILLEGDPVVLSCIN
jgi:hypothetical protein